MDKEKKEILDRTQDEIIDKIYGKSARRRILFSKLGRFRIHIVRILVISLLVFFVLLIFGAITGSSKYSDKETKIAEQKLKIMIQTTGSYQPRLERALALLQKYPEYYKKVVNNIQDIKIQNGICQYACIYTYGYRSIHSFGNMVSEMILPEANLNKKTLIINPGYAPRSDVDLASMLVHEADHVEYLESGKLRRAALYIKCNPLLNPHISINSRLSSITHRIKAIEICAQKEQIKFHELSNTKSGYESENGLYSNFGSYIWGGIKNAFAVIFSLF